MRNELYKIAKKIQSLTLLLIAAAGVQTAFSQTVWDGTANTSWHNAVQLSFTISTAEELAGVAKLMKDRRTTFEGQTVTLGANIMLNDTANWKNWESSPPANEWEPIGGDLSFKGTFDGNGKAVSGVYIPNEYSNQGFFNSIYSTGTVKNLGVKASHIKGIYSGVLAGENNGTISNSYAEGSAQGNRYLGGLVGQNYGKIISSHASVDVNGGYTIGGLVGKNTGNGEIIGSYATGNVQASGRAGGFVGENEGRIFQSYARGNMILNLGATNSSLISGFVGANIVGVYIGKIINCYSTGEVDEHIEDLTFEQFQKNHSFANIYVQGNSKSTDTVKYSYYIAHYPSILSVNRNGIDPFDASKGPVMATVAEMQSEEFMLAMNFAAYLVQGKKWVHNPGGYPTLSDEQAPPPMEGKGTKSKPWIVKTKQHLEYISWAVHFKIDFGGEHISLENDIALGNNAADQWHPIGVYLGKGHFLDKSGTTFILDNLFKRPFKGTFDGNNHIISGLYIDADPYLCYYENHFQGLFGILHEDAVVKNLGLEDSYVKGANYVGGLAGLNHGTITNSYSKADVEGMDMEDPCIDQSYYYTRYGHYVGGLVGSIGFNGDGIDSRFGTISGSYATGNVKGYTYVGGLAGDNYGGTIVGSYATGDVEGVNGVGGLAGYSYDGGTISGSHATGNVKGIDDFDKAKDQSRDARSVGGLIGYNENGTITNSYATGKVEGTGFYKVVGGLAGISEKGTISSSYATGDVYCEGKYHYGKYENNDIKTDGTTAGGLVGSNEGGVIIDSYATGNVEAIGNAIADEATVSYPYVGGLAGYNYVSTIISSYATGNVKGNTNGNVTQVGGLVGFNNGSYIFNSHATGNVEGKIGQMIAAYPYTGCSGWAGGVGGLAGTSTGIIINSYATGSVNNEESEGSLFGSLVGTHGLYRWRIYWIPYGDEIINSYATGNVIKAEGSAGSLFGEGIIQSITLNSYAKDIYHYYEDAIDVYGELNEVNLGLGLMGGGPPSHYGIPKTTAEIQSSGFVNSLNTAAKSIPLDKLDNIAAKEWAYEASKYPFFQEANPTYLSTCDISEIPAQAYTGSQIKPEISIQCGSQTLVPDTDYDVYYGENINVVGIVIAIGTGKDYIGAPTVTFAITKPDPPDTDDDDPSSSSTPSSSSVGTPSSSSVGTTPSSSSAKPSSSSNGGVPIISQTAKGNLRVQPTSNAILLENLPPNTKVEVYNLQGKRVYSSHSENSQILKILVQTKGIYVVKAGSKTVRVAVR